MSKQFKEVSKLWDDLLDEMLFTYEELLLITNMNGFNVKTLNDAIYTRYGYRDLEQLKESEE